MTLSPIKTLNSEVKSCTGTISGNFSCENDFLCKKCTQIYQKVVSLPLKQILVSEIRDFLSELSSNIGIGS